MTSLGFSPSTSTTSCVGPGMMKRVPGLSSMETMQKSVMNAFSLKYSG